MSEETARTKQHCNNECENVENCLIRKDKKIIIDLTNQHSILINGLAWSKIQFIQMSVNNGAIGLENFMNKLLELQGAVQLLHYWRTFV